MSEADIIQFNARRLADERANAPQWETADRVRKIRRIQNMTQDEFAKATGTLPGTLRSWEAGVSEPRQSALLEFAVTCQVKFDVPAWWTMGQAEPANVLESADPRARATAMEILRLDMAAAAKPKRSKRGRPVRREGIEPPTRWLSAVPVFALAA